MRKVLQSNLFVLLVFLSTQTVFSQEIIRKGAHQLQKVEFGNIEKVDNNSEVKKQNIIPLQQRGTNTLNKMIFGFLPYWEQSSGAHNNIQYNLLSHIACFDFLVQLDASITTPAGWPWITEINAAHAAGTKVVMTVVNFGGVDDADAVAWELFTNTSKRDTFFANIKSRIIADNLDGVNIDFESITSAHRGAELNTFMAELTTYIHTELPGKEVSFDGPAVNWGGWIMDDLVNSVDYLIIMAYDYTTSSSANSGPVAPLIHPTSGWKSVIKTLESSTFGYSVPVTNNPDKLILAVPYYGQHWTTVDGTAEATTISHLSSTRFKNTVTEAATHGDWIWNDDFESPWYTWDDGVNWNQVWADNELSVEKKFDLAITKNLGGIGMWALNYDGVRPELWDLINTKFGITASVEDSFIKDNIRVYPNPTSSFINISNITNLKFSRIEIFNVIGQAIMQVHPESKSIDVSHLTNGMYFLKIEDKTGKQGTFKVLKSN
ncbi:MAG: T9SS type A sorting domain-containing protein [Bacteroidetes bacterium]|nr:T9SS type A sorting domain-containing protein [Bacteroidota bacterium]